MNKEGGSIELDGMDEDNGNNLMDKMDEKDQDNEKKKEAEQVDLKDDGSKNNSTSSELLKLDLKI